MIQELIDLRQSIIEGRTDDALEIIDDLNQMGRKSLIRNIKSYLVRMLIHLIKNQVEQRLTNSWAVSIRESVLEIQDLNLMDNQKYYYVKTDELNSLLEQAFDSALYKASLEVDNGKYKPVQLLKIIDKEELMGRANQFVNLTYSYSMESLGDELNRELSQLPGGEDWNVENRS